MNQFGNFCSSYRGDGYEYQNANGSRYISYPDGSSFYDPGSSGVGRKWYTSPDGQKHFLDDEPKQNKKVKYEDSDDSDATDFLSPPSAKPSTPKKVQTAKRSGNVTPSPKSQPAKKQTPVAKKPTTASKTATPVKKAQVKPTTPKTPRSTKKQKEVHIHVTPKKRPPPTPENVTRVIHHSAKGDKEIIYRSPVKPGKNGKISKGEKKVVHIHHHRNE